MQPVQPLLQIPAGNAMAAQIHQHQVVVRAAGYQVEAAVPQGIRQGSGVFHRPPGVIPECRLHSLSKAHGLPCDDMQQRAALHTGEHGAVNSLGPLRFGQDHTAPGATESLVGGCGHHVGIGHRALMLSAGHQPGNVGHIHHQQCPVAVGNVRKCLKHQHPGPRRPHNVLHPVIVDAPGPGIHPIADSPI